jgi:dTDP-4-dehydrorhamnose 3,5-epimerase
MSMGPVFTPLRRIATPKGEVRHGLRASDPGFAGFGEAYFSEVLAGEMKGWKRHTRMTMNLIVVSGTVRFVLHDGAGKNTEIVISAENAAPYGRLTVPPGFWMAFEGMGAFNLLMNLASHEHDPAEAENREIDAFPCSPSITSSASND